MAAFGDVIYFEDEELHAGSYRSSPPRCRLPAGSPVYDPLTTAFRRFSVGYTPDPHQFYDTVRSHAALLRVCVAT